MRVAIFCGLLVAIVVVNAALLVFGGISFERVRIELPFLLFGAGDAVLLSLAWPVAGELADDWGPR